MSESSTSYRHVIEFWLGNQPLGPDSLDERRQLWYGADASIDALLKKRFGGLVDTALAGGCRDWEQQALPRLALIIVLDQFTRNIYRGRAQAFAGDARAVHLALDAIDTGMDGEVGLIERSFFICPYSTRKSWRSRSARWKSASATMPHARPLSRTLSANQSSMRREHRDIVARFGRFPHRNKALGRHSTATEKNYLADGAPDFGQSRAED